LRLVIKIILTQEALSALYYSKLGHVLQELVLASKRGLSSGHLVGAGIVGVVVLVFEILLLLVPEIVVLFVVTVTELLEFPPSN
jgi:hypothetical protein